MNPYIKEYKKTQIETATPEKILIMLYDGAIQYLNVAKAAIEGDKKTPGRIQKIHDNIMAAQRIITEFMNTLDMEIGGEVAENLYDLYTYLYRRLVKANIQKDSSMVEEVLNHLKGLRETWAQAIEIARKEDTLSQLGKNPGYNNKYAKEEFEEDPESEEEYEDENIDEEEYEEDEDEDNETDN